ncbi:MAG TPA: glycosyltransferase [Chryseolinea sp.]|nr:glycosyltransferase [Chryseolinea sp.]
MYFLLIVYCSAIGIQTLYFFLFAVTFSRKRVQRESRSLPISVIVCAHDEEENLNELIPLLLAQLHPSFEIIIVNDRSNDNTFDMLLAEASKDHRLRMVHVNRTPPHVDNKKYALTLGIKAARYEWILLTDADCRPVSPLWLSEMSKGFSDNTDFVLGYSPYLLKPGLLNILIRFEAMLTGIQYISFASMGMPYMGVGRNLAYRRSKFLEVKGFNNILHVRGGDDDLYVNEYSNANNTTVCIEESAQVNSIPKQSWSDYFNQKVRHLSVGKRYRIGHRLVLGLFMVTWIVAWLSALVVVFSPVNYALVGGLFVLRMLALIILYVVASKKLGQKFEWWTIPLLDFIYAFYYLVTGLRALVTKKVKWKN